MKPDALVGYLKNSVAVYDRADSHVHTEYEGIWKLITELLPTIISPQDVDHFHYSHDFGYVIGESICVHTDDNDEIVYAQRPHRDGKTCFIKNRPLRPTSVLTIVFKRDIYSPVEQYILITAYMGEKAPPEPWDALATIDSIPFWNTHALVWGSVQVIEGTETLDCPW